MKLWEVIKALDENPRKVFSAKSGDSDLELSADIDHLKDFGYTFLDVVTTCEVEGKVKHDLSCLGKLSADWQPVRQPVTWQEAIQAWGEGRKIRIKNRRGGESFYSGGVGGLINVTHDELVHGTWYVED
jgi:hypothetical protein